MIDKKTIQNIAKLARLKISEEEANDYSQQLTQAMDFFEKIAKVDTTDVEPMVTPTEMAVYWREDVVVQEHTADEMVANAPARAGKLFKVPPVV